MTRAEPWATAPTGDVVSFTSGELPAYRLEGNDALANASGALLEALKPLRDVLDVLAQSVPDMSINAQGDITKDQRNTVVASLVASYNQCQAEGITGEQIASVPPLVPS